MQLREHFTGDEILVHGRDGIGLEEALLNTLGTRRDNWNALYRLIQAFDFALLLLAARACHPALCRLGAQMPTRPLGVVAQAAAALALLPFAPRREGVDIADDRLEREPAAVNVGAERTAERAGSRFIAAPTPQSLRRATSMCPTAMAIRACTNTRRISASAENRGNSCQRKHPAEILALGPSCASTVAARTRIVSAAGIRLDHRKSVRPFKGIFCDDIS